MSLYSFPGEVEFNVFMYMFRPFPGRAPAGNGPDIKGAASLRSGI